MLLLNDSSIFEQNEGDVGRRKKRELFGEGDGGWRVRGNEDFAFGVFEQRKALLEVLQFRETSLYYDFIRVDLSSFEVLFEMLAKMVKTLEVLGIGSEVLLLGNREELAKANHVEIQIEFSFGEKLSPLVVETLQNEISILLVKRVLAAELIHDSLVEITDSERELGGMEYQIALSVLNDFATDFVIVQIEPEKSALFVLKDLFPKGTNLLFELRELDDLDAHFLHYVDQLLVVKIPSSGEIDLEGLGTSRVNSFDFRQKDSTKRFERLVGRVLLG